MLISPLETGFFLVLFLSVYSYGIYPWVLFLLARLKRNDWVRGDGEPVVSIVISVYNEEGVIQEKIRNTLELEYPPEKLEIIISSDGSTDQTNSFVSGFKDPRVVLMAFPERAGKTSCLNRVVPPSKGEIVIFTDANSIFPPDLPRKMVRNFADPEVGMVTGWTRYRDSSGDETPSGIYTRLERQTKIWESSISSCVGADGAVFAMRKSLYQGLRDEDINDFVLPLQVVGQGKRVILDPEVLCYEETGRSQGEYRRQVRITTRTLGAILRNRRFLNPLKYRIFAFFLFSHKLLRFMVAFFLLAGLVLNAVLAGRGWFFQAVLVAQLLFIGAGLISLLLPAPGRIGGVLKFFFLTTAAQMVSWFRVLTGKADIVWTPRR